ncbi:hypothetical protein AB0L70_09315 [Kribbella sp. NPDC051952]|jgi:hypothetical protein|uniref:hypothetical protein n=1 Tax=Kribbella sp. NPDC051952 TaxID=3154851 RepID=UPI0034206D90
MAHSFIHVFSGDVSRLGTHADHTADQHQAHVGRYVSETDMLGSSFQCTAADINQQGVMNASDRTKLHSIERGRNEASGLYQSANLVDGAIGHTTQLMMQQLNL